MRTTTLGLMAALTIANGFAFAQPAGTEGSYRVLKTVRVGGEGGFDYVYADSNGRRLYIPRTGPSKRISVFNLDTLQPAGEIANVGAHGVAVDPRSHHGFASSKPVVMWDTKTMKMIKSIDVEGNPDGILCDSFNERVYVLSHSAPNVSVIDAQNGSVVGTIDLGGAPEQAAADGKGRLYVDIEDKNKVAVLDAVAMKVIASYDLGENKTPAGLALDVINQILFVECRNPAVSVIMSARDGKIINTLPIGAGVDGAGFMRETNEAFSSQGDGTLTIVKEKTPTDFEVEENVKTMISAKTMSIDSKTKTILLIAAEFGPAPPTAPGERPRRGPMVADSVAILKVGR